jgi:hypothetical protein
LKSQYCKLGGFISAAFHLLLTKENFKRNLNPAKMVHERILRLFKIKIIPVRIEMLVIVVKYELLGAFFF